MNNQQLMHQQQQSFGNSGSFRPSGQQQQQQQQQQQNVIGNIRSPSNSMRGQYQQSSNDQSNLNRQLLANMVQNSMGIIFSKLF